MVIVRLSVFNLHNFSSTINVQSSENMGVVYTLKAHKRTKHFWFMGPAGQRKLGFPRIAFTCVFSALKFHGAYLAKYGKLRNIWVFR